MEVFTVKATYRSETRKFTFSDSTFPTYDQLYNQLYRVFPISHSFYLSKLLFSTNTSTSARLLIGKEVHSAEQYDRHVAPYRKRSWPGAILRFSVYDETPHKASHSHATDSLEDTESHPVEPASPTSTATMNTTASSATVVGPAAEERAHLRGNRRILLDRIRESTNNRSSVHTMPPTPPASSRPTSMVETIPSRPTSLSSEPAGWRPLPARPHSRGESTTSAASSRTARPSLFDLLANPPSSSSVPKTAEVESSDVSFSKGGTRPAVKHDWDGFWKSMDTVTELNLPQPPEAKGSSPVLPSFGELGLPRLHRFRAPRSPRMPPTFVAPPPPILFSQSDSSGPCAKPQAVPVDGDVVMFSPPSRSHLIPPGPPKSSEATQSRPQPSRRAQPGAIYRDQVPTQRATTPPSKDNNHSSSPKLDHCCSMAEGKAEILALMEKFKQEFEYKMAKTFGEDWDKASAERVETPLPHLPSPPTHIPTLPMMDFPSSVPPPPPLRQSQYSLPLVPPPPPLPAMLPPVMPWSRAAFIPPPSGLLPPPLPPPPPPCIIPPPPPLPLPSFRPVSPSSLSSRSSSPAYFGRAAEESRGNERPLMQRSGSGSEATVHKDVRCDFCGKRNIQGTRFKCLQCPDYDWCSACMASPKAWEAHSPGHAFFPIHQKEDFLHFCLVKDRRARQQVVHNGITCDGCEEKNITGVRHKCLQCEDYDLCDSCVSSPRKRQKHDASHGFFPVTTPGEKEAYNRVCKEASKLSAVSSPTTTVHTTVHCDGCEQYPLTGVRHKCLDCQDYDLCTACLSDPKRRSKHDVSHAFFPMTIPSDHSEFNNIRANHRRRRETAANSPRPVGTTDARPVHTNIVCDICQKQVVGVRHKCLDCADYDLCEECISVPSLRERHSAQHQFFAIEKPGEVIVHTVFSGDGEREPQPAPQNPPRERRPARAPEEVLHNAFCNMCDSRIRGHRYKCLNCPDYDVCQSCHQITTEQHPGHGFVKISEPEAVITRDNSDDPVHFASCNVCRTRIRGVRYKCMHESCHDFDLCENCEALPISVHPDTHPLLKIRNAKVVMPTVLKADEVAVPRFPQREISVPRVPSRVPSPYELEYVDAPQSPSVPMPFIPGESMLNAPAQRPALPLPMFTPEVVESQSVLPIPEPYFYHSPVSLNPFRSFSPEFGNQARFDLFSPPYAPIVLASRSISPVSHSVSPPPPFVPPPFVPTPFVPPPDLGRRRTPSPTIIDIQNDPFDDTNKIENPVHAIPEMMSPLVELEEVDDEPVPEVKPVEAEGTTDGISTPSDVPASTVSASSVPKLGPVNNEVWELWPELYTTFKHLLAPQTPQANQPATNNGMIMPGAMFTEEPKAVEDVKPITPVEVEVSTVAVESPLVGEPLLCRPLVPERAPTLTRSLSDLIGTHQPGEAVPPRLPIPVTSPLHSSPVIISSPYLTPVVPFPSSNAAPVFPLVPPSLPTPPPPPPPTFWQSFVRPSPPLLAAFVSDNNIPVGQIFPPGAEFVKSWRMRNDGTVDWPEGTQLVFVAGDRMAPYNGAPSKVNVGSVKAGEEVELVSGEMKAPEVPGKYVSSWRLSDGNGNLFGNSVWVDITVAEMNEVSSDESLAASSVIMPHVASQPGSAHTRTGTAHRFSTSSMSFPSAPPSEVDSSVSLLDVSSSDSDDDDVIYEDSRSRVVTSPEAVPQDVEYVMLFDSSSSEDD